MHYSTFLTLAGAFSLVTASPFERRAAIPSFPPGTVWDIVLDNSNVGLKELQNAPGKVIDIDLLDIIDDDPNSTLIKDLAKTKTVICYFSAGSREEWRKDAGNFTQGVDYGKPLGPEWPREAWVNVKSAEARSIMESRIVRAAAAGCNAVDPDNVDGYVRSSLYFTKPY
jgi:endo-alpha-1,4-polygalactosaminidase (GH114 family)